MTRKSKKLTSQPIPITLLSEKQWKQWLKKQTPATIDWIEANHFAAEVGEYCMLPSSEGNAARVLVGVAQTLDIWSIAALPEKLAPAKYILDTKVDKTTAEALYLGWLLGSYRFAHYKKKPARPFATLVAPAGIQAKKVEQMAECLCFARDLINTPANDLGPEELAAACKQTAHAYKAQYNEIVGDDLIKKNYPAIYEVGKASTRAPRLLDMRWGNPKHPKITLVGKGVCFDSGGLDIKPSSGMKLMKKDMGGAACVLALARLIMASALPIRLRVLIPAVENSIAGNAYRPSDVINTRKGITVEVGNTDAEGRLILCDALHEADKEKPALLIDCATLTGAARTALGTDVPALFTSSETLAAALAKHSQKSSDPLWRLPLWEGYREMLNSQIADINSAPDGGYAGAITAALYLKEFVTETKDWAHIDMMAWNLSKRAGRPVGGEAMAVRTLFAYITERFGT
jgi:leucyl aminopeptidase